MSERPRWYVGVSYRRPREAFRARGVPTIETYAYYGAVIGPYRTKRGAMYAAANPWVESIAQAERWAAYVASNFGEK